jgi:hypothetical protein
MLSNSESLSAMAIAKPAKWIGKGFNIYGPYDLMSSVKTIQIFDARKAGTEPSDIGDLPEYCEYLEDPRVHYFEATGDSKESFQRRFSARASVDVTVGAFSGHTSAQFSETSTSSSRYFYACRAYMDQMGALVQSRFDAEYLSDEFKARLDELPVSWSEANLARFADFFDTFGAYFVSRVTLGNTLEYYVSLEQSSKLLEKDFKAKVEMEYDGLFVSGSASAEMRDKQKWSSYQENRRTSAVVKGGDRTKAAKIAKPSVDNFETFAATKKAFDEWVQSTTATPALIDFSLKGIWEVCGAKRNVVESAFREYGRHMRPLVIMQPECVKLNGFKPTPAGVYLNGWNVPASSQTTGETLAGYQVVVIDRKNPTKTGIVLNKLVQWSVSERGQIHAKQDALAAELKSSPYYNSDYFMLFVTFGQSSTSPSPSLATLLREVGGGLSLEAWATKSAAYPGTVDSNRLDLYALAGWFGAGSNNGVEIYGLRSGSDPKPAKLSVYFYFLGKDRPYALGIAERGLATSA